MAAGAWGDRFASHRAADTIWRKGFYERRSAAVDFRGFLPNLFTPGNSTSNFIWNRKSIYSDSAKSLCDLQSAQSANFDLKSWKAGGNRRGRAKVEEVGEILFLVALCSSLCSPDR